MTMTVSEILLAIAVVIFGVYASVNIVYIIEVRRTTFALRQLIKSSEENLLPALASMRHILGNVEKAAGSVAVAAESVRAIAETAGAVEKTVKNLYGSYVESTGEAARANIAGLKAGVKTGVVTLLKNLTNRKEGSS